MFFPSFNGGTTSELPNDVIFAVEHLTTQILINAEPRFLGEALQKGNLVEALLQELEFFGQLQKSDFPAIQRYLSEHEASLQSVAKDMVRDPENTDLRRHLSAPTSSKPASA